MQDGKQGGITPFQAKGGNHTNLLHVAAINEEQKNWPTVCASEVRQGFQDRSRGMKGSQESLTTAVVKDAANWSTPRAQEDQSSVEAFNKRADAILARRKPTGGRQKPGLTQEVQMYGQAAPASSSSLGSRQGLWQTPKATNADCPVIHNPQRSDGGQPNLAAQMVLEQQRQWMTPRACEAQNPPMGVDKRHHGLTHQVTKQWLTPKVPSGGGQATRTTDGGGLRKLEDQTEARATGKLNPRWVETLMGLPIGWTMPSCTSPQTIAPMSCDSSAMELCLPPQSELSEFSLAS
jgi:hypothetical protein